LDEKRVTHPQEYDGRVIILENVPAEVCQQCGEVLLRPEILEHIQRLVWSKPVLQRTVRVPVYDLTEVG